MGSTYTSKDDHPSSTPRRGETIFAARLFRVMESKTERREGPLKTPGYYVVRICEKSEFLTDT